MLTKEQISLKNQRYHIAHKEKISLRKKKWAQDNPEKVNKHKRDNPDYQRLYIRKHRRKHPERYAAYARHRAYGVTKEWFDQKMKDQDGKCMICSKELIIPNVDHDHQTNEVRDILCGSCNRGLGMFKDNFELLLKASQYLKKHKRKVQW